MAAPSPYQSPQPYAPPPYGGSQQYAPPMDPNALLRHIDQQTTQMFHWIRIGVIVIIILLILVVLVG